MAEPVAALDCGTNSTRLLIASPDGSTLDRRMVITRLGAGVDAGRRLSPEGVARTVDCLNAYRAAMDDHGVSRARMVATSAARDAFNRDEFLAAAFRATGVRPELLDGQEEGRLSFAGATSALPADDGPYAVIDIGGGSTELVVGGRGSIAVSSVDLGCVRVSERFLISDPPTAAELRAARTHTASVLSPAAAAVAAIAGPAGPRTLVGLAGTVSTAAMLDLGLDRYDRDRVHHHVLSAGAVGTMVEELSSLAVAERALRPGIESGREDVIVGGLLVLEVAMAELGFGECLVSESDILDGIVMGLLARDGSGDLT